MGEADGVSLMVGGKFVGLGHEMERRKFFEGEKIFLSYCYCLDITLFLKKN